MSKPTPQKRRARQIISRLAHEDDVSENAIAELVGLGEAALEALSATVDVEHIPTQRVAALALSRMGTRRALAPMLNMVTKVRNNPELVATLLNAAAVLLEPRDKERVRPFLLRCLQHESATVRLAAVDCVKATDDEEALAAVMSLHRDPDQQVQTQAAQFISNVQTKQDQTQATVPRAASMELITAMGSRNEKERRDARTALLRHPDSERVVLEHLYHQDSYVRRTVLEVAAVLTRPAWRQALLDIAAEEHRSPQERSLAMRGVSQLGLTDKEHQLIQTLMDHSDLFVRAEAIRLAATSENPQLTSDARARMQQDAPWVRKRYADGWAASVGIERPNELPQLVQTLNDNASWLQRPTLLDLEAFQTLCGGILRLVELGGFIDREVVDELSMLRVNADSAIAEITRRTLESLSRSTGIMSAVDRIDMDVQALYEDNAELRMRALTSLENEDEAFIRRALPSLIRFLYSANIDELVAATKILSKVRDRRAIEALARMAHHPDSRVRKATEGRIVA